MLKPLGKNILVQKIKEEEKKGFLILTNPRNDNPFQAKVLDKGSKVELEINVDNVVLLRSFAGVKVTAEDDGILLITEADIFGVIS